MDNKKKIRKMKFFKLVLLMVCTILLSFNLSDISAYAYENRISYYEDIFESIDREIVNLESKYNSEDSSDMNELEKEKLNKWDNALNEIYKEIINQISESEKEALIQEEIDWINYRDNQANAQKISMEIDNTEDIGYNRELARLTKERCYYLLDNYMKSFIQEENIEYTQDYNTENNISFEEEIQENNQNIDYSKLNKNKIKFSSENKKINKFIDKLNDGKYKTINLDNDGLIDILTSKFKQTIDKTEYIYKGELKKNRPNGMGFMLNKNSNQVYIGNFKNGQFSGFGILIYEEDNFICVYEGYFEKGKFSGKGNKSYDIEGNFYKKLINIDDDMDVKELFNFNTVLESCGTYKKGKLDGKATIYYGNGVIYQEGKFKSGKLDGKGKIYYSNGNVEYEGEFKKGKYNGKGTLYNEDGSVNYKGKWKNGDID